MASTTPSAPPLDVVVRFSSSDPDITLHVPNPGSTSALTLKQQIRKALPAPQCESRLRLIHAGKVVPDQIALSNGLHARVPPPPRAGEDGKSEKAKGKQPLKHHIEASRVYVHCSIGDALLPAELTAEASGASDADAALASAIHPDTSSSATGHAPSSTTTPAPRGFDRLLTAGFTAAEVATLRTQFLAIQAHTHTPDTMPTGQDLLALEELWLDNGSNTATGGGEGAGSFGGEDSRGLDDLIWGNLMGFFWPVGAMFWLMREEGVWSGRRQTAVLAGFVMNLTFGLFRMLG